MKRQYNNTGWFPDSEHAESLETFLALADYAGEYPWDDTDRPPVIRWGDFEGVAKERAAQRDKQRAAGLCFWPWIVAEYFDIPWIDPNQGTLGTCAGFAADTASFCMLLQHLADGLEFAFERSNPYPAWVLGREDAGYRGGGASMSMVLNGINKYGRFPISKAGTYEQSTRSGINWRSRIADAEPFQVGCTYLGSLSSRELADAVLLCVRAGHPVAFGGSTAVSNKVSNYQGVKIGKLSGRWSHATAFVAYREIDGEPYLAHVNSWGNCYGPGKTEGDPGSVVWLSEKNIRTMCSGAYRDAFAITYAESTAGKPDWDLSPIAIPFPQREVGECLKT